MNAMVAMQLDSIIVFLLVLVCFVFRFLLKQYSLNVHYKTLYEKQLQWQIERLSIKNAAPLAVAVPESLPYSFTAEAVATA
jgi:hypothetical protein